MLTLLFGHWTVYSTTTKPLDQALDSIYVYICQLQRNPHLETTTRARLYPKHVDERSRIVQETASKNSQAIPCRWRVRRWGWVGPDAGKSFGWDCRREVSTRPIVTLLSLLHQMIWLDRYIEKKGPTHRSERVCFSWDRFNKSVIPIVRLHMRSLRNLQIILCVLESERKDIPYMWWGRVVVRYIVIGCVDVWWILHFILHDYISRQLRDALSMDAFLVATCHMRVLKYDRNG